MGCGMRLNETGMRLDAIGCDWDEILTLCWVRLLGGEKSEKCEMGEIVR